jgi:hypothetical protein
LQTLSKNTFFLLLLRNVHFNTTYALDHFHRLVCAINDLALGGEIIVGSIGRGELRAATELPQTSRRVVRANDVRRGERPILDIFIIYI